jgi:hypothetical protein
MLLSLWLNRKKRREAPYSDQEITHVRCQCLSLQCGSVRIGLVYAGVLCSSRERGALSALEGLVSREKTTRSHKTPDTGGLCTSRLPDSNHEILYPRQLAGKALMLRLNRTECGQLQWVVAPSWTTPRRAPAAPASDVMAQEALDHRVHLVGHLELVEDAPSDGPTMHDGRQPL